MYAVEFLTEVNDGKIEIPKNYQEDLFGRVKVIILKAEIDSEDRSKQMSENQVEKAYGMLSQYANPKLIEQEDGAWERAVIEKYEDSRY